MILLYREAQQSIPICPNPPLLPFNPKGRTTVFQLAEKFNYRNKLNLRYDSRESRGFSHKSHTKMSGASSSLSRLVHFKSCHWLHSTQHTLSAKYNIPHLGQIASSILICHYSSILQTHVQGHTRSSFGHSSFLYCLFFVSLSLPLLLLCLSFLLLLLPCSLLISSIPPDCLLVIPSFHFFFFGFGSTNMSEWTSLMTFQRGDPSNCSHNPQVITLRPGCHFDML